MQNDIWGTNAEIPYSWGVTTQEHILVGLTCHPNAPASLLKIVCFSFSLFFNSTSSCSHAPISIGRPSSYPPSTKGNPQVSDVSPLSLSTTPPEVSIAIHQESITCTVAINLYLWDSAWVFRRKSKSHSWWGNDHRDYTNNCNAFAIKFENVNDVQRQQRNVQKVCCTFKVFVLFIKSVPFFIFLFSSSSLWLCRLTSGNTKNNNFWYSTIL